MDLLQGFAQKDMIEQITILDEIKESRRIDAVPGLLALYAKPLGDQAVDEMVYHTLYELLAGQEEQLIKGLGHESAAVQLLCVRRAGADGGSEALKNTLADMLTKKNDPQMLSEIIRSLGSYKDPALLGAFLPYVKHDDYAVVAWAMKAMATLQDEKAREVFETLVRESADVQVQATGCDLRTALAIENLAAFNDEKAIAFLIGYIHHSNPSFRRVVITSLASMDEAVLPALERCLVGGERDEKIMAANIVGLAGYKQGADMLVAQLEHVSDSNLKFAIYEALGRITSMRSVIGLSDGLAETDELVLLAVITGLDEQCNPGVLKIVGEAIAKGGGQGAQIVNTIVTARAKNIFSALYKDGKHAEVLMGQLLSSGNAEAMEVFRGVLEKMGSDQALTDAKRLSAGGRAAAEKRLLAADDSKAMLFFYKGVAADLGMELVTVEDGKKAFDLLQADSRFDLVITDMNMPNMDGIELTREIRKRPEWAALPILMATTESEKSQTERAAAVGVNSFITKPFNKEDFKAKIAEMFK